MRKLPRKEHVDIGLDMEVIARERLRRMKADGVVPKSAPEPMIPPFGCMRRGYLCSGGEYIMMFNPDAVAADLCAKAVNFATDVVIECWILYDDKVQDYCEFMNGEEGSEDEDEDRD